MDLQVLRTVNGVCVLPLDVPAFLGVHEANKPEVGFCQTQNTRAGCSEG